MTLSLLAHGRARNTAATLMTLSLAGLTLAQLHPARVDSARGVRAAGPAMVAIATNPLSVAREGHTATLLHNGRVLVAGGRNESGSLNSAQLYDPDAGTWSAAGNLGTPRHGHAAVMLPNGRVLVAGGQNGGSFLGSAEIYDPVVNEWSPAAAMGAARLRPTATLLANGKVLVVGGENAAGALPSAEEYDPSGGAWSPTNPLTSPRRDHTATLLATGRVLVTGGLTTTALKSAELYDPGARRWRATADLNFGRRSHTATLLPDGTVLVAGGQDNNGPLSAAEVYTATNQTWAVPPAGGFIPPRRSHTATLLPGGKVLVTGGLGPGALNLTQLYDPAGRSWANVAPGLIDPRSSHTATLLPNGKVLVVGGSGAAGSFLTAAELLEFSAGEWTEARVLSGPAAGQPAELRAARQEHTATLLSDGRVLVTGGLGANDVPLDSAEIYNPVTGEWGATGRMGTARRRHTATLLTSGRVLVTGGFGAAGASTTASAELYDPALGSWSPAGSMSLPRREHTATLLRGGKVLVAGGAGTNRAADLYDPDAGPAGSWGSGGLMNVGRRLHSATLLPNGRVLVAGGDGSTPGTDSLASTELYHPDNNGWTSAGDMRPARREHVAVLLPNGKVIVNGGLGPNALGALAPLGTSQFYDPNAGPVGTWSAGVIASGARINHTATLLLDGKVLLAGGYTYGSSSGSLPPVLTAELYDPAVGAQGTIAQTDALITPRDSHTATLLLDGRVLVVGGFTRGTVELTRASAELYDAGLGYPDFARPIITDVDWPGAGAALFAMGVRFRGVSESSSGAAQSSASDYPVMRLRSLGNGQQLFLTPGPGAGQGWTNTSFSSLPVSAASFPQGPAVLIAFTNGIPSPARVINSTAGGPPTVSISGRVTDQNGRGFVATLRLESSLGEVRVAQSSPSGEYSFTNLLPSPSPVPSPERLIITGLEPNSAPVFGDGFPLTVNGIGFSSQGQVTWNGGGRQTSFVSSSRLTAQIPSSDINGNQSQPSTQTRTATVVVERGSSGTVNPGSNPVCFLITRPPNELNLTSVSPARATAGGPGFTLSALGQFGGGEIVQWNGQDLATTLVSAGRLNAIIPASLIATPAAVTIRVRYPNNQGFTNPRCLNVFPPEALPPVPIVTASSGGGQESESVIAQSGGVTYTITPTATTPSGQPVSFSPPSAQVSPASSNAVITSVNFLVAGPLWTVAGLAGQPAPNDPNRTNPLGGVRVDVSLDGMIRPPSPLDPLTGADGIFLVTGLIHRSSYVLLGNLSNFTFTPLEIEGIEGNLTDKVIVGRPNCAPLSVSIDGPAAVCQGQSVTLKALPGFGGYLWSPGGQTTQEITVSPTATTVYRVTVTDAGGCTGTAEKTVTVNNCAPVPSPPPVLSGFSPAMVTSGGPGFTLTVSGSGFVNSSVVRWNGADRPTTYASETRLTAAITREDIATPRRSSVTVFTPGPGGGTSAAQEFAVIALTTASAASFSSGPLAAGAIVAAFGVGLSERDESAPAQPLPAELAGRRVLVNDREAQLFSVLPSQINYLIPQDLGNGMAAVKVVRGSETIAQGTAEITRVAPGLFTANSNGLGVPAAVAVRVKADGTNPVEAVARFDQRAGMFVPLPLDLGPESEPVFLILFGTGFRFRSALTAVSVRVGGIEAPVEFAGAVPGFVGLDQINARLPRTLVGRGDAEVILTVDGQAANTVQVNFK